MAVAYRTGCTVYLVIANDAPPGLAYRIFRDGTTVLIHNRRAYSERLARAILEYLDFKPVEDICTRGVLRQDGRYDCRVTRAR